MVTLVTTVTEMVATLDAQSEQYLLFSSTVANDSAMLQAQLPRKVALAAWSVFCMEKWADRQGGSLAAWVVILGPGVGRQDR